MRGLRPRLTYANVMSSIAVFLTLGGATALAAGQLGRNTVGTKQLKKNSITAVKIKNGAVTGIKVKSGSLTGTQVDASTLGTVSNATHAASADSATNSEKLDGFSAADLGGVESSRTSLIAAPAISANNYWTVSGVSAVKNSALQVDSLSPGSATVARNLAVSLSVAPGSNDVVKVRLIVNGAPSALECSIANAGTTDIQSAAPVSVPAGSTLALQATELVSGAGNPGGERAGGFSAHTKVSQCFRSVQSVVAREPRNRPLPWRGRVQQPTVAMRIDVDGGLDASQRVEKDHLKRSAYEPVVGRRLLHLWRRQPKRPAFRVGTFPGGRRRGTSPSSVWVHPRCIRQAMTDGATGYIRPELEALWNSN